MERKVNELFIPISEKWDLSPHLFEDSSSNFHVDRSDKASILDFFLRKREGALLISGKRGVGKTSILVSTINEACQQLLDSKNMTVLPVIINAANFEIWRNKANVARSENDSASRSSEVADLDLFKLKRALMENLVRRLYQLTCKYKVGKKGNDRTISPVNDEGFITQDTKAKKQEKTRKHNPLKDFFTEDQTYNKNASPDSLAVEAGIAKLFMRAVAKEATSTIKSEATEAIKRIRIREFTAKVGFNERLLIVISSLITSTIIGFHPIIPNQFWNTILSVIITVLPILSILVSAKFYSKLSSRNEDAQVASTFYRFDYDLSNLESEIESTLMTLQRMNCKVIFVIDEVDKITSKEIVTSVIKLLKALFNQGYAVFVVVTGPELFREVMKEPQSRLTEYTLFSQTLFLQRAQFEEVRTFIERIMFLDSKKTNNQNAVRLLFDFDGDIENKTIEYFTKRDYPIEDNLQKIENARIKRIKDNVIITYEKTPGAKPYEVKLSRKNIGPRALIFPDETSKSIICEFGVSEKLTNVNGTYEYKYTVYSKSIDFSNFQYYACYLSRTDFFDLYKVLRDYIKYGELGLRVRINETIKTYANLQRALEYVFLRKKFENQSDWSKNDMILDYMYSFLTDVTERHLNLRFVEFIKEPFHIRYLSSIEDQNMAPDTIVKEFDQTNLDGYYKDIVRDALTDLIRVLLRFGFLATTSKINVYEVSGSLLEFDIAQAKLLVKEEKDFIDRYFWLNLIIWYFMKMDDTFGKR